jgi:hypothetical protein
MNTRNHVKDSLDRIEHLMDAGRFQDALTECNVLLDFMEDLGLDLHEDYKVVFENVTTAAENLTAIYMKGAKE